jgi:hypothetical protein
VSLRRREIRERIAAQKALAAHGDDRAAARAAGPPDP